LYERKSQETFYAQKGHIFHLNPAHHLFCMNFEQKCTDTLAELDNIPQNVMRGYSYVQNPTVVNRMPW